MPQDVNSEMLDLAKSAIKLARNQLSLDLDYSEDRLEDFDSLVAFVKARFSKLASEGKLKGENLQRASISLGAYLGEVIRRKHGGLWAIKSNTIRTLIIDGQEYSPVLQVYKWLTGSQEVTLKAFWSDLEEKIYAKRAELPLEDDFEEFVGATINHQRVNEKYVPQYKARESNLLQNVIASYVGQGYRVISQTQETAQLVRPKRFSWILAIILLLIYVLPFLLYLLYYAVQKDESIYIMLTENGKLSVTDQNNHTHIVDDVRQLSSVVRDVAPTENPLMVELTPKQRITVALVITIIFVALLICAGIETFR
jgi:hypothetical protein